MLADPSADESPPSLWNVQEAINTINQTYEIDESLSAWNYRAHSLLGELLAQTEMFSCSGGIWTQTTDVEGEVNGLLTYDRRVLRPNLGQWQSDIQALYNAAAGPHNASAPAQPYWGPGSTHWQEDGSYQGVDSTAWSDSENPWEGDGSQPVGQDAS